MRTTPAPYPTPAERRAVELIERMRTSIESYECTVGNLRELLEEAESSLVSCVMQLINDRVMLRQIASDGSTMTTRPRYEGTRYPSSGSESSDE